LPGFLCLLKLFELRSIASGVFARASTQSLSWRTTVMTDTALFTSVYGLAMLVLGLALTAFLFNRMPRQRRQRIHTSAQSPAVRRDDAHGR